MTDGATENLPQHVPAPFVRRHHSVCDQKRRRPGVVGKNSQRDILFVFGAVGEARHIRRLLNQGCEQVGVEIANLSLQNRRHPLQPQAGIDRRAGQRLQLSALEAIELHKHQVPNLHVAAAVLGTRKLALLVAKVAPRRAQVVVKLGTGPTRARLSHGPEVVLLIAAEYAGRRDPHIFAPEFGRFIVVAEDRDPQAVRRQAEIPRHQIPGPDDDLALEVAAARLRRIGFAGAQGAEAEITKHLEEGMMAASSPHLLQVVVFAARAHALLRGAGARVVSLLLPQENIFELVHSGVREKQRRVVLRNQRRGGNHTMAPVFKEFQKFCANLVRFH